MKKIILLLCTLVLLCTGCGVDVISNVYSNNEKIASEENSFNLVGDDTKVNGIEAQGIENQKYFATIGFEGMDTIWEYTCESDTTINISYLLSVSAGKSKIVLISPNGDLTTIVENTDNSTQENLETISVALKEGKNRIKLVAADKAVIDMKLEIEVGNFEKVGL